jgi:hypothetical protein
MDASSAQLWYTNLVDVLLRTVAVVLCRPYGTYSDRQSFPALKRWANLFRAYGARSLLLLHFTRLKAAYYRGYSSQC